MKRQSLRFIVVIMLTLTIGASMVLLAAPQAGMMSPGDTGGTRSGALGLMAPEEGFQSVSGPAFQREDGGSVTLEAFRGKIILLNFWATWCPPCVRELPALDRVQARLGGEHFQVVPVSTDLLGASALRQFYERHNVRSLPIYQDPRGRLAQALGVEGLPTTMLIDTDGTVIGHHVGFKHWDAPEFMGMLEELVALSR
jgi:thiol-disulfide isomerase/thioredoxin